MFNRPFSRGRLPGALGLLLVATGAAAADSGSFASGIESSAGSVAASAFLILLREGFEAILILAAIYAALRRTGQQHAARFVHAGWIGALAAGALTWLMAARFITFHEEDREVLEGVMAVLSAAMLLYVGYWLHSNAHAERWQAYLQARLQSSTASAAVWPLVSLSFLAVYREAFETILFYEALWLQSGASARLYFLAGILGAVVCLTALALAVLRFSVRLPVRLFFQVNAGLLFVMAVIFAGKGIAALEEAGILAEHPVDFPQLPVLGLYADAPGLSLQAFLVIVAIGLLSYRRWAK